MPKSSIQQYQEFQDYTNYIDTSDVMLDFYKNEDGMGLEKYYLMIEEWLSMEPEDPQKNQPLVIQGDGGVGKKTLLVKWYEYHQSLKTNRKKDLTILHFGTTGGNNSNYFYAIYRILIKLREELNIGQKVELHQEKIRKYFSYWLDVCNQRIENQAIQNLETIYEKIILVFEGIDYFLDRGTGKQGNIAFWLPKYFPKNVKVIVTADGESESMKYFNNLHCQKVQIPSDIGVVKTMIKWQSEKQLCVSGSVKDKILSVLEQNIKKRNLTSLYVKSYLSCLLPEKLNGIDLSQESLKFLKGVMETLDFEKMKELKNIEDLFDYLLDFWGNNLLPSEEKFKQLIGILISTQKGLTRSQIISTTKITQEQLKLFITLFRSFLMNFKDLWMIKNDSFKKAINNKYEFKVSEISQKIAQSLKKTPNSVRKLEEETFQLYTAGNYFKLKEVISDIQNFLLLFNPYTKYDLCKYWQRLEEKSFDPVIEYNKAIEGFEMHYHPTSDDLFRIITQISRFLKEFADFQTYYTPQFRHPKIIGNPNQLSDIGILGQFRNLQLSSEDKQDCKNEEKILYQEQHNGSNENEQEKKLRKKIKEMYEKIEQGKHIKKINKIQLETPKQSKLIGKSRKDNKLEKEGKQKKDSEQEKKNEKKKKDKTKNLTVQQLNVQVKSNQEQFRKYYYQQIKPFLEKYSLDGDQKQTYLQDNDKDEDYQDSDKEQNDSANLVAKIKNIEKEKEKQKARAEQLPDLKQLYAKTVEEEFQLNQKPPTNYYYKRWIWMQFPWVCMTMKCDYSDKLRKCFTSPTSYMSVSEERQFTLQALKIALEAKRKKQAILEKTEEDVKQVKKKESLNPIQLPSTAKYDQNKQSNDASKFEESLLTYKTKSKKKGEDIAFVTNSFLSLNNLSKQLQNINYSGQKKENKNEEDRNSLFITAEDKTFEEYSSLLHSMNKKKKKQIFTEDDVNISGKSRQGILPRIKQNVNQEMIKELEQLEKNNSKMRKQVDTYLYKNKVLAKKLKELKIIQQNNNNQIKNEKKISETKSRIGQLEKKIEKVKYQYAYSLLEHERLNVLIKICQKNKTQNEEAIPDLALECNNFKKMITIESQTINELNKKIDEIKKLTKKFLLNCYEKVKNQTTLNEEIQLTLKNREQFHEEVQKYDQLILQEIDEKRRQLNEKARSLHAQNEEEKQLDKTKKSTYHEDEQNYQEIFSQIMKYLDLNQEGYRSDPKYLELLDGLAKKKELQVVVQERKVELEQLEKRYQEEKRQIETLEKADDDMAQRLRQKQLNEARYENELQEIESEQVLEKRLHEKQRVLKKITDVKLSCLGMLNTWYSRLGLPEQNQLIITEEFLKRIEQVKTLHKIQNY